jgi:hypothetical protein
MSRKALKAKPIELPDIPWRMTRGEKKRHRKLSDQLGVSFKDSSQLYRDLRGYRTQEWADTVHVFEANPRSFYNAWHYLNNHPVFWTFGEPRDGEIPEVHERNLQHEHGMTFGNGLEVTVHRVDPKTDSTSEDPARNTRTEVWYELSLTHWPTHPHYPHHIHDYEGDGGAKTYEKAIVKAARRVHELYGNDRRILDAQLEDKPEPESVCHCPAHQKSREGAVHHPLTPITISTRKPGKWRFVDTETKQVWFWDDSSNTFKLIDPVSDAQELADADLLADPDLQESLAQCQHGETVPATTLAEEWERKAKEAEAAFARIETVLRDFTVRGGYQPAYDTAVRLIRAAIAGPDGS